MVSLANALTVVGSGNNPECSGEIAKRSVPILLEPKTAHPEMRVDFQHANLREYVRANRRNILAALLGMVEMWKANKRPMCPIRMGGFEAWSGAVGGIMRACGFTLWRSNAFAWARGADPRGEEIAVFVQAWADMHGTRKCTATELMRTAEATEMFTDEFERKSARGRATVMGSILRKIVNRPVDIWAVRRLESSKPPTMYYLERLPGQAKSGDSESEDTEY